MPIISRIGARSWKVRLIYTSMLGALIVGSISILYPFSLMLSGSFKSDADFIHVTPYPRYWSDDELLFRKYAESKYGVDINNVEAAWRRPLGTWQKIAPPAHVDRALVEDFLTWRRTFDMPAGWYTLGHSVGGYYKLLLPKYARLFRNRMSELYAGDVDAFSRQMGVSAKSWDLVVPPRENIDSRRHQPEMRGLAKAWRDFKITQPRHDRAIVNLDGVFWRRYLVPTYTNDIAEYNRQHGTEYSRYDQVLLTRRAPAAALARDDWESFVRNELNMGFIRLDAALAGAYRRWLASRYGNIETLNERYSAAHTSFEKVAFPTVPSGSPRIEADRSSFVKDRRACPAEHIEVYGPRQAFEQFVAGRRGVSADDVSPLALPLAAADYHDCTADSSTLRWEFATRNYKQVLQYVLLHGRGIINTLIYCGLAIATALLVNPLAAYALSQYNLRNTYKILLFCMATMAFPGGRSSSICNNGGRK